MLVKALHKGRVIKFILSITKVIIKYILLLFYYYNGEDRFKDL